VKIHDQNNTSVSYCGIARGKKAKIGMNTKGLLKIMDE
jgi:hypothetical protein